jgi:hypothetical protein
MTAQLSNYSAAVDAIMSARSGMGQKRKDSDRTQDFRFTPESRNAAARVGMSVLGQSQTPFSL